MVPAYSSGGMVREVRVQRAARGACDAADSARCSLRRWTRHYWSQRDQFHHVLDASALAPSVRHLCRNHPPKKFQAPSERHHPHALPEEAAPTGLRNLFGVGFRQRCRADGAGRVAELRTAWSAVSNVRWCYVQRTRLSAAPVRPPTRRFREGVGQWSWPILLEAWFVKCAASLRTWVRGERVLVNMVLVLAGRIHKAGRMEAGTSTVGATSL